MVEFNIDGKIVRWNINDPLELRSKEDFEKEVPSAEAAVASERKTLYLSFIPASPYSIAKFDDYNLWYFL